MALQARYKKPRKETTQLPVVEGKRWYNLIDASAYMAAKPHFLRDLIRTGKIRYRTVGHGFVLDKIDLDQFLLNKTA
jgi:hypothetical protein